LNIHEREADVFPAVDEQELEVALETILVDCVGGVDSGQNNVVEESLEGWNAGAFVDEQGGEGICCCDAEGKDLSSCLNKQSANE
jgi:hypothetical protein